MLTLFTLASGRSGTSFLADFFRKNVKDCYSTHEPYLVPKNPVLFGKPIYWNAIEDDKKLLPLLKRKHKFIARCSSPVYFESNHAILKSCHRHVYQLSENPSFIHLVRNPLLVAKSELNRECLIRKVLFPFAIYKVESGERFFYWSLTGREPIYSYFIDKPLTRFQFYCLQWIEIEKRAIQLIADNNANERVYFIDVDKSLNSYASLLEMLDFFKLDHKNKLRLNLKRNRTPFVGPTIITKKDKIEFAELIVSLPDSYLTMLTSSPYNHCEWQSYLN